MENTIIHREAGKPDIIYHGVINWLNRREGTFWFETRLGLQNLSFWGKTDYWSVTTAPIFGRIKVEEEND